MPYGTRIAVRLKQDKTNDHPGLGSFVGPPLRGSDRAVKLVARLDQSPEKPIATSIAKKNGACLLFLLALVATPSIINVPVPFSLLPSPSLTLQAGVNLGRYNSESGGARTREQPGCPPLGHAPNSHTPMCDNTQRSIPQLLQIFRKSTIPASAGEILFSLALPPPKNGQNRVNFRLFWLN